MKRVLLVDADVEVLEATRAALEADGYEVEVARDGNEALAQAERMRPDVIVLELILPRRSGVSVLETLAPLLDTPVIVATTAAAPRHRLRAEELGVRDFIRKPYLVSDLLASVHRETSDSHLTLV